MSTPKNLLCHQGKGPRIMYDGHRCPEFTKATFYRPLRYRKGKAGRMSRPWLQPAMRSIMRSPSRICCSWGKVGWKSAHRQRSVNGSHALTQHGGARGAPLHNKPHHGCSTSENFDASAQCKHKGPWTGCSAARRRRKTRCIPLTSLRSLATPSCRTESRCCTACGICLAFETRGL